MFHVLHPKALLSAMVPTPKYLQQQHNMHVPQQVTGGGVWGSVCAAERRRTDGAVEGAVTPQGQPLEKVALLTAVQEQVPACPANVLYRPSMLPPSPMVRYRGPHWSSW